MSARPLVTATAAAAILFAASAAGPAQAQQVRKPVACSKIMDICMRRAGDGHAGVCEDMYSQARNTGVWPATAEPDGTQHAPVPCTR